MLVQTKLPAVSTQHTARPTDSRLHARATITDAIVAHVCPPFSLMPSFMAFATFPLSYYHRCHRIHVCPVPVPTDAIVYGRWHFPSSFFKNHVTNTVSLRSFPILLSGLSDIPARKPTHQSAILLIPVQLSSFLEGPFRTKKKISRNKCARISKSTRKETARLVILSCRKLGTAIMENIPKVGTEDCPYYLGNAVPFSRALFGQKKVFSYQIRQDLIVDKEGGG